MVKYLKSYLNLILLLLTVNCTKPDEFGDISILDRKKMSTQYLENAEKNFNQGSIENMELIEIAIRLDPQNSAAWRELSVPYLKRGIPHQWKPLFDKAVEVDPIAWQGWRGYLKLFFYRDYESAIEDFNATDILTPNFTDYPQSLSVDYLRGLAYLQLKKYQIALDYFTKYIEEVTSKNGESWVDVNAFVYKGIILSKMGKYSDAIANFQICLKYYESSSDAYFQLARINLELGNKEDAKSLIIKAKKFFNMGYNMKNPYVETFEEIYIADILDIENRCNQ